MQVEPAIAFPVRSHEPPALEIRVNFGVFAGREATPAELDVLGKALLPELDEVTIVAEQRHEMSEDVEASLHQVVVQVGADTLPADEDGFDDLEQLLVETAEGWAWACIADRHAEVSEL